MTLNQVKAHYQAREVQIRGFDEIWGLLTGRDPYGSLTRNWVYLGTLEEVWRRIHNHR